MRIYVPATSTLLQELHRCGRLLDPPITAFAVTAGLTDYYTDTTDLEELEYLAASEAARASLRLLAGDSSAVRRRVVVAADLPEAAIAVRDDLDLGVVRARQPVMLADCACVHIDGADAEATVAEAVTAIDAADLADPDAEAVVSDAEGFELLWYATQELAELLAELDQRAGR